MFDVCAACWLEERGGAVAPAVAVTALLNVHHHEAVGHLTGQLFVDQLAELGFVVLPMERFRAVAGDDLEAAFDLVLEELL